MAAFGGLGTFNVANTGSVQAQTTCPGQDGEKAGETGLPENTVSFPASVTDNSPTREFTSVDGTVQFYPDFQIGDTFHMDYDPFGATIDFERYTGSATFAAIGWVEFFPSVESIDFEVDYQADLETSTSAISITGTDEEEDKEEDIDINQPQDTLQPHSPKVAVAIGGASLLVGLSSSDTSYSLGYAVQDIEDDGRIIDDGDFRCGGEDSSTSGNYGEAVTVDNITPNNEHRLIVAAGGTAAASGLSAASASLNFEFEEIRIDAVGDL